MTMPSDRREHPRLEVQLVVHLEAGDLKAAAVATNISEQGLRLLIVAPTSLQRKDEVLVELQLRDGAAPVRALGWVTGVDRLEEGDAISLTFFGLPEADAARIRAFVTAGITV